MIQLREDTSELGELLYPDVLVEGEAPERRVVYCGLTWERYLQINQALGGEDRGGTRLFYLEGRLEFVNDSARHEWIRGLISSFLEEHCYGKKIPFWPRGAATIQLAPVAMAEPADSWCIGSEKKFPDLVLEVILNDGGIPKLAVYRHFGIPEVWVWKNGTLAFHRLQSNGSVYHRQDSSSLLPGLDIELLYRCAVIKDLLSARQSMPSGIEP